MDRLRNYASAKGYSVIKEVKEIGSGLNDKRQQLEKIFKQNNWDILIVEHKDRLARFGINYIEILLDNLNKKLDIINIAETNSKEDLMQDFISIITSFTARLYGLRRSKRKTDGNQETGHIAPGCWFRNQKSGNRGRCGQGGRRGGGR